MSRPRSRWRASGSRDLAFPAPDSTASGPSSSHASPAPEKTAAAPKVEKPAKQAEPGSERFVLENGLTVILRPIKGTESTALVVLYAIGNDHDPAGKSGLAHMLEHVYVTAAAGQAKARTAEEFAGRYAEGANGQTGDRYTVFATVFPKNDLETELKDAAARMGDLRLTADDLARERPRLLTEVDNMFGDFPMLAAVNNARELVRPTPGEDDAAACPRTSMRSRLRNCKLLEPLLQAAECDRGPVGGRSIPPSARERITAHFGQASVR